MTKSLVETRKVEKNFDMGGYFWQREKPVVKALNKVSVTIKKGEIFCLVGESGCGKSTLARCIMGLLSVSGGEIYYQGERLDALTPRQWRAYRRRMQMIFQNPYASLNPRRTIQQTLEEPLRFHFPELSDAEVREKVVEVMTSVGNDPNWGGRYPHEFSGGQRQRISIARTLVVDPEFVVADEPISALDVSIQAQVLNVMMDARDERELTYLFITHDLSVVQHFGTRVGVMYLGSLCELAPTRDLFSAPRHPYTRILLNAIPQLGGKGMVQAGMMGEVPTALKLPSGCVFHPRCPHADDRCRAEVPELISQGGSNPGQVACHAVAEGRI